MLMESETAVGSIIYRLMIMRTMPDNLKERLSLKTNYFQAFPVSTTCC